jgi:hypothetical protein
LIVSLLTLSCGGGGGSNSGGSGGSGAPSISNLQTGPNIFLSKFSRNFTVTGKVDFYDPDGNVSKLNIKTPLLLVLSMALANLCHLYIMVGIGIEGVGSEMWDE